MRGSRIGSADLMSATLIVKDLAAGHGDRLLFSGPRPGGRPRRRGRAGRGQRRGQVDAAADPRRAAAARSRARSRLSPPTATVGYLPQEPERRPGRDGPGLPGPPYRGRPPRRRALDAATEALADGAAGRRRRVRRRPGALARPRRRRPGRAGRAGRRRAGPRRSTWTTPMTGALRRPGGPRRAGLAAAQPVRRLPARRADQRPRPGRAGPAGDASSPGCAPARCWSATTGSS